MHLCEEILAAFHACDTFWQLVSNIEEQQLLPHAAKSQERSSQGEGCLGMESALGSQAIQGCLPRLGSFLLLPFRYLDHVKLRVKKSQH